MLSGERGRHYLASSALGEKEVEADDLPRALYYARAQWPELFCEVEVTISCCWRDQHGLHDDYWTYDGQGNLTW